MRLHRLHTLAFTALLATAACDNAATGPEARAGATAAQPSHRLLGTITCHVDVASETTRCGDLVPAGGASHSRFILDTAYWSLQTGAQFNSGGLAYFFNEIHNDLGQDIGIDGMISDTTFAFITNITTTGGSGTVTPNNHDGRRGFTAPNQYYWAYEGVIGANSDSGTEIWTFNLPATVTSWTYTIGVQTAVMHPDGWIEISGTQRIPLAGSTQFTAVVRDWTGTIDTSGSITWTVNSTGGSVSTVVNNSRQATFTGTGVGYVGVTASKGFESPHTRAIEVY